MTSALLQNHATQTRALNVVKLEDKVSRMMSHTIYPLLGIGERFVTKVPQDTLPLS